MYYIMSEPHGDEEAYFAMKEQIGFRSQDELYILGDVLGGDPSHPEKSLRILEDIIQNKNIHLVIGDFEYAYIQYEWHNKEQRAEYKRILSGLYGGTKFINYMKTLPEQLRKKYINYLIDCDVREVIQVGQRTFYLVHGSPSLCIGDDLARWEERVVETPLDLKANYKAAILSDRAIKRKNIDCENLIIVVGHKSTKDYEKQESFFHKHSQIIFCNNRFLIYCGSYEKHVCVENTLCCLGISEDGEQITIHYRHEQKKEVLLWD